MEAAEEKGISLEDILQFLTGSRYVPLGGFGKEGEILFLPCEITSGQRITVKTCFLMVRIPLSNRYAKDLFGKHVIEDNKDSPRFRRL